MRTRTRPHAGSRPVGARCPSICRAGRSCMTPDCTCPACGGAMRKVGEDITEVLDYVPGRFEVIRHIRPAFSCRRARAWCRRRCRRCRSSAAGPAPGCSRIFWSASTATTCRSIARPGSMPATGSISTARCMADWVGKSVWLAAPLVEAIGEHVMAGDGPARRRHAGAGAGARHRQDQDRPAMGLSARRAPACRTGAAGRALPLLARPQGRASAARTWLASAASCMPTAMPASARSTRARRRKPAAVAEVACWAHVRRKFYRRAPAPDRRSPSEALDRIGALFDIERAANGLPPDMRRRIRQRAATPLIDELAAFSSHRCRGSPARANSPARSAMPARAGMR